MELMSCAGWLAVQRSKYVFFLILYDSINNIKYFPTVCITTQACHSHFCCWLLPIWPKLDVWAENGPYGLCRLGWQFHGAKLYFSWPILLVSMIWNTSKTVSITPQPCHSHLSCQLLPIWPQAGFLGWKWSLWSVPTWLAVQQSKAVFYLNLNVIINDMKYFWTVCITPQPCHIHFCCWLL